jgi:shikimate dehydrogenase
MMAAESRRRMRFVGVSTGKSSIMRVFPRWCEILGLDAELVGLDLPLDAPPEQYRAAMRELAEDPDCVGALVTTHKIGVYQAAADLFDSMDDFALACGEVSSIVVRDGRLSGAAKDPLTAGRALEEFLAPGHFSSGAEVVCLGAGGAGTAIGWYLAGRPDAPARMTFVDPDAERLRHLSDVVAPRMRRGELRTIPPDDAVPAFLDAAPPGTLVVNASGMGKDRPGSPLGDDVPLPRHAVVWELNYRGSLEFLQQALAQREPRSLATVVDGWRYFIHGWTHVMADVFEIDLPPDVVEELARVAEQAR